MDLLALILAAGKGKRMKSKYPKVIHKVLEKPMLSWIMDKLENIGINDSIVVLGYGKEYILEIMPNLNYAIQNELNGTGGAVKFASQKIENSNKNDVIILYGDVPLIEEKTIKNFYGFHKENKNDITVAYMELSDPYGYGRMVLRGSQLLKIVEESDASEEEKKINKVNSGIMIFKRQLLVKYVDMLKNDNNQGEYYLTDTIELANKENKKVGIFKIEKDEVVGANTRKQLYELNKLARKKINDRLMDKGVSLIDPESTYIGPDVEIGKDTIVGPNVHIYGKTKIGEDCFIGENSHILETAIGNGVKIKTSYIEYSTIKDNVSIGPFARIRMNALLENGVRIGNFVEVKKSHLKERATSLHLAYLGDADIGKKVNIGAGSITCNYDGVHKHKTIIEDHAFIGTNNSLIAPIKIGRWAVTAAGTAVNKDVPDYSLVLRKGELVFFKDWAKEKFKIKEDKDAK